MSGTTKEEGNAYSKEDEHEQHITCTDDMKNLHLTCTISSSSKLRLIDLLGTT